MYEEQLIASLHVGHKLSTLDYGINIDYGTY